MKPICYLGSALFICGVFGTIFLAHRIIAPDDAGVPWHREMLFAKANQQMIEKRDAMRESNDALLQEANADYENDLKTFSIAAAKNGTFLSITMVLGLRAVLVAVNLANVSNVVVDSGHPPDQDGTLRWSFYYLTPRGMQPAGFDEPKDASGVETWVQYYWRDRKSSKRTMFSTAYYRGPIAPESSASLVPDFKATRFAQSSVIRFIGTETELYVPFGRERKAYDIIVEALGRPYDAAESGAR